MQAHQSIDALGDKSRTSTDSIIHAMLRLHEWRLSFNGDALGSGYDQLAPHTRYDYAEAYALWGLGYLWLAKLTGLASHLEMAEKAAQWLLDHPSPAYKHLSWGLPWSWTAWDTSPTLSYLITTVFTGDLLLALYKATGKEAYLSAAKDVAAWIEEENGGDQTSQGLSLYYANFPPLHIPVVNPTAKASGFFAKLYECTKAQRAKDLGMETARWVLAQQNSNGSWYYSRVSHIVDNVHTGFTLEGMWDAHLVFQHVEWRQSLERGTSFYWQRLFTPHGGGLERKPHTWRELGRVSPRAWLRDQLMALGLLSVHPQETRSWGYGAAMRAFTLASYVEDSWLDKAKLIWEHVTHNLLLNDGSYAFRRNSPQAYIRCEAHLFAAFGFLAQRLYDDQGRSPLNSVVSGTEAALTPLERPVIQGKVP